MKLPALNLSLFIILISCASCSSTYAGTAKERETQTIKMKSGSLLRKFNIIGNPQITVFERETGLHEQPLFRFYVRSFPEDENPKGKNRCLYFCNWQNEPDSLIGNLTNPDYWIVRFADKHKLTLVTWNTSRLKKKGEHAKYRSERLNLICTQWFESIKYIGDNVGFKPHGGLIYGISRGATYAQGLVIRNPGFFAGVHTHIGGAFEKEKTPSRGPVWLLTTGSNDFNRQRSVDKYQELVHAGRNPIFKVAEGLQHESRGDVEKLASVFFDYVIRIDKQSLKMDKTLHDLHSEKSKKSLYFSDVITNDVFSRRNSDIHRVPADRRVYLPADDLADAWKCWNESEALQMLKGEAFLEIQR